jgi:hypothetical protein
MCLHDVAYVQVAEGFRPARGPRLSDEAWELISRCWHPDPCERPAMGEVVAQLTAMLEEAKVSHIACGTGICKGRRCAVRGSALQSSMSA